MVTSVSLQVEVVGCPTICQHCWAQGIPYDAMPILHTTRVLDGAGRFFPAAGVSLRPFPMHEVAAHPEAARVLTLFQGTVPPEVGPLFEPLSTTGGPIATRPDWREILTTCRSLGATTVFLAVHGVGDKHDWVVHREGAYGETLLAADRARSVGLDVGCNVFLTRENVGRFDALVEDLRCHGVGEFSFEPATYYPTARGRRYETLRPELYDLSPLAERVQDLSPFWRDRWADPGAYTEAAWVRAALAGEWSARPRNSGETLELVCRRNFDVYSGAAGLYRRRHGNLQTDGDEAVWGDALEHGVRSSDELWFGPGPLSTVPELAERFGDSEGRRIHFTSESIRLRWLDLSRRTAHAGRGAGC